MKINKWILMFAVVFFIFNGIHYINVGCLMYKKRVAYLDKIVSTGIKNGKDTYYLSPEQMEKDKDLILVPWALGTETLLYSNFKYGKNISVSAGSDPCGPGCVRMTSFFCIPASELNKKYFSLSGNASAALPFDNH
ncbi:MAG: hypothetical protein HY064_04330 [Bacteroidetes bacterium]|nr:hypothetical protein [Bacteroidota bacterium]